MFITWFKKFFSLGEYDRLVERPVKIRYSFYQELEFLADLLHKALLIEVKYTLQEDYRTVVFESRRDRIATLSFFADKKANTRKIRYLVVRLEPNGFGIEPKDLECWFKLAFMSLHVSFRKPMLQLQHQQIQPRER